MKRILLLGLLTGFLGMNLFSQVDRPFHFGLHFSPLIGWMKPDALGYTSEGSLLNINYGFSTEFRIATNYTFATGLDIMTTGGKLRYPHQMRINETDDLPLEGVLLRRYKTQYLQLPLSIRMRTNEIGYLTFYGQFGFTTGFNLSAKANDEFDYAGSTTGGKIKSDDVDIQKEVSFFRAGMLIGIGAEYSLGGSTALSAGFAFNNGFTDVLKGKNSIDTQKEENAISNLIEVSLGIIF
jgi:hypothetical protein